MATNAGSIAAIRRVLIGFGCAETPTAALDIAAQLAAAFHAEMAGIFVEEDMLYQLSELPAIQVLSRGGTAAALDRQRIHEQIVARAKAWRRALSARAESRHMAWSFESRRGEALAILRGSARADDVLLVTGTAGAITLRAQVALALQAMETARAVLVVPDRPRQQRGAVVVFGNGNGAEVDLAASIARTMQEPLLILTRNKSAAGETPYVSAQIIQLPGNDAGAVADLLRRLQPRLLVARSTGTLFADAAIAAGMIQAAGAPILLLRSGE